MKKYNSKKTSFIETIFNEAFKPFKKAILKGKKASLDDFFRAFQEKYISQWLAAENDFWNHVSRESFNEAFDWLSDYDSSEAMCLRDFYHIRILRKFSFNSTILEAQLLAELNGNAREDSGEIRFFEPGDLVFCDPILIAGLKKVIAKEEPDELWEAWKETNNDFNKEIYPTIKRSDIFEFFLSRTISDLADSGISGFDILEADTHFFIYEALVLFNHVNHSNALTLNKTPLHLAVHSKAEARKRLKLLAENDGQINVYCSLGATPLHEALKLENIPAIKAIGDFFDLEIDFATLFGKNNDNYLHFCCVMGMGQETISALGEIIPYDMIYSLTQQKNKQGLTPAEAAFVYGNSFCYEFLTEAIGAGDIGFERKTLLSSTFDSNFLIQHYGLSGGNQALLSRTQLFMATTEDRQRADYVRKYAQCVESRLTPSPAGIKLLQMHPCSSVFYAPNLGNNKAVLKHFFSLPFLLNDQLCVELDEEGSGWLKVKELRGMNIKNFENAIKEMGLRKKNRAERASFKITSPVSAKDYEASF